MKKPLSSAFAHDEEGARTSREWQAHREQKFRTRKERRAARLTAQTEAAIQGGVCVQQLPPGPKWQGKKKRRKANQQQEISRLRSEVHTLSRQLDRVQSVVAGQKKVSFYDSPEWHRARYEALKRSNGCCELCGTSKRDGAIIQVDHIKPRSKYPELELEPTNLQVLCRPCNMGKSNRDEIDWRRPALKVVRGA